MSEGLDRQHLLDSLFGLTGNVQVTVANLVTADMVDAGHLVQSNAGDIQRANDALENGDFSTAVLERWAGAVHNADDVAFDATDEAFLVTRRSSCLSL